MASSRSDRSGTTVLIHESVSGGGMVGRPLPKTWAAEGGAIRRAIVADFAAVGEVHVLETIDARSFEDRLESRLSTRIIADPSHPIDLGALAKRADASIVVAPESDGALEGLARWVGRSGGRSLGASPEAIALCSDKLRLARHFAEGGAPTPPTRAFVPSSGLPWINSPTGRVVVKPVDGAGAIDTFVLEESAPCPPRVAPASGCLDPAVSTGSSPQRQLSGGPRWASSAPCGRLAAGRGW